jgi:two-component system, response regulator
MAKTYEKVNVLVVEDNPDDLELTIHAVKRGNKNANIIHLSNGEEVLDYLQKVIDQGNPSEDIKLIMLNLRLPRMDGLEVLKRIRENLITQFIPIVVLTSSEDESKINEAYKLGANSYVIKPTSFELYMDRVSSVTFYWSTVNTWPNDLFWFATTKTRTRPGSTEPGVS